MPAARLLAARYRGDAALLETIRANPKLGDQLVTSEVLQRHSRMRTRLLSDAVRVDPRLLPRLAEGLERVRERAGLDEPIETFVFESSAINASVTRGGARLYVSLSSGAVNLLSEDELEFVIGHELGHALFDHVDLGSGALLDSGSLEARERMQVLAWKRASEISADRIGLLCCGSIESAATALFKTLSGLDLPDLKLDPVAFAEQWDHLSEEVVETGGDDHWQLTHPFPPLRMKAMLLFAGSDFFSADGIDGGRAPLQPLTAADAEIERLLAMMDPLARDARRAGDPLLADLLLWGGLAIALANGSFEAAEEARLAALSSADTMRAAKAVAPDADAAIARFEQALAARRQRLRAIEIHRIIEGLLQIADSDGAIDPSEGRVLATLAARLGVSAEGLDLLKSRHQEEGGSHG